MGSPDGTRGARLSEPVRRGRGAWPGPVAAVLSGVLHAGLAAVLLPGAPRAPRPAAGATLLMVMVRPIPAAAPVPVPASLGPTTVAPARVAPAPPARRPAAARARRGPYAPGPVRPMRPSVARSPVPAPARSPAPAPPPAPPPGLSGPPAPAAPIVPPRPVAGMADDLPPLYPLAARRRHEQGRVVLRVDVSADGGPIDLHVLHSSGSPALDEAARDAVRHWRFVPARQGDRALPAIADVPVSFRLEN